jgi:dihydropyrimidinase
MTKTLLRGGTIWTAESTFEADVYIVDGVITALGTDLPFEADETVDLSGKILIPGGVDVHTHLDAPVGETHTVDDFESGTVAAACGGTTTIVDFATQQKGQGLIDTVERWHEKAVNKAVIDYGFHISITDIYRGALDELGTVVSDGVTSFKIFMDYPGTMMLDDGEIFRVLQAGGQHGAKVLVHASNGQVIDRMAEDLMNDGKTGPEGHLLSRPPATEVEAVNRAIAISRMADAPLYFVHLSTEGATMALAEAQDQEWPIAGETCTHYLTLDEELYYKADFEGAKAVLTPPLRGPEDRGALWRSLRTGTLGIVSSDHCPFCFEQKKIGIDDFRRIPNGGSGIEHRLQLMYSEGVVSGQITPQQFVDLVATTPAKSFGLYPQKGEIAVGSDADITVLDPQGETRFSASTHNMKSDYSLWEGWARPGSVDRVYSRGDAIVQGGVFVGKVGRGRYIERKTL